MKLVNLPEDYFSHIERSIDEKGVYPHQMMLVDKNDGLGLYAIAMNEPCQVFNAVMAAVMKEQPKELIYGLDRFAKSGQGTKLGDLIAGNYWNGEVWRPFIIEYQHEPRVVKPLNWGNEFWNAALKEEWTDFLRTALGQKSE